jgi:hypothetical protein
MPTLSQSLTTPRDQVEADGVTYRVIALNLNADGGAGGALEDESGKCYLLKGGREIQPVEEGEQYDEGGGEMLFATAMGWASDPSTPGE